jgi:hypothetical protein
MQYGQYQGEEDCKNIKIQSDLQKTASAAHPRLFDSTLTIAPLKAPAILFAVQDARHQVKRVVERVKSD